jgi:hypothetical protein
VAVTERFTHAAYADLVDAIDAAGCETMTVREYLSPDRLPERFVVLRHDVDRKPGRAEELARLEADLGVSASYYFHPSAFRETRAERVADMGHEVGYHYDDVATARGDLHTARALFANNLRVFRRACDVDTVSPHAAALSHYDNASLWEQGPSFEEFDLLGDADRSVDYVDLSFFSDAGRTFRERPADRARALGERDQTATADTPDELAARFREGDVERACLLTHPRRWTNSLPARVLSRSRDRAATLVHRGALLFDDSGS